MCCARYWLELGSHAHGQCYSFSQLFEEVAGFWAEHSQSLNGQRKEKMTGGKLATTPASLAALSAYGASVAWASDIHQHLAHFPRHNGYTIRPLGGGGMCFHFMPMPFT